MKKLYYHIIIGFRIYLQCNKFKLFKLFYRLMGKISWGYNKWTERNMELLIKDTEYYKNRHSEIYNLLRKHKKTIDVIKELNGIKNEN